MSRYALAWIVLALLVVGMLVAQHLVTAVAGMSLVLAITLMLLCLLWLAAAMAIGLLMWVFGEFDRKV